MTPEGFGRAYQKGFSRTVGVLRSRGASQHVAEDFAQAAWLQGWQKLNQLRDERTILNWVIAIAINFQRRGYRVEARYQGLSEICGYVGVDLTHVDAAKILSLCSDGERTLFEQQLSGLTVKEIAAKYGVTSTAIRIRLLRARRAVRTRIEGPLSTPIQAV